MNLPEEVLEKILSRLPTKYLLQLRSVCKTWRTLISHPLFIKTHLRRQLELPEIGLLYLQQKGDLAVDLESHLGLSRENIVAILDSCHGLLCTVYLFHSDHFPKPLQELILWNPCTRQGNRIPSPGFVSYKSYWFCFFYDSDSDDYKIVRILTLQAMDRTRVDIFSLKSKKWRTVEESHGSEIASQSATYFKGNIHWLAFIDSRISIIGFSLRDEKFLEMKLASQRPVSYLTVLGGRLHVGYLHFLKTWGRKDQCDVCFSSYDMWVMEEYGMEESWKRVTSFFPYSSVNYGVDLNGSLPLVLLRSLENGTLLLVADGSRLVLCDSKNNTWKDLTSYKQVQHYQKEVSLYIETLVSPCGSSGQPKRRRLT